MASQPRSVWEAWLQAGLFAGMDFSPEWSLCLQTSHFVIPKWIIKLVTLSASYHHNVILFRPLSASFMDLDTSSWTILNLKPRAQDSYDRRAEATGPYRDTIRSYVCSDEGGKPLCLRYLVSFGKMCALEIRKLAFLWLWRLHTLTDWSQKKYEYFVRSKHHLAYNGLRDLQYARVALHRTLCRRESFGHDLAR